MNFSEMITERNIINQCEIITNWFKQFYQLKGIAFLIQDARLDRTLFCGDAFLEDALQHMLKTPPGPSQSKIVGYGSMVYGCKERSLTAVDDTGCSASPELGVLVTQLTAGEHPIGVMALVGEKEKMQSLLSEKPMSCWLSPLISNLLDNAICHENKDRKIRLLNLYQTVSSSLAHLGDLQELLTTIMMIVTSELSCEEGSVLLHHDETNEFEFFIAVGESGDELTKLRFPADRGIAGRALKERKTLAVNDVQSSPDFYGLIDEQHDFKTTSLLAAPLVSGNAVVGVIEAINKMGNQGFDQDEKQIFSAIADEVALAIRNAKLLETAVECYCTRRQGELNCRGCKRPLKSWTPCPLHLDAPSAYDRGGVLPK